MKSIAIIGGGAAGLMAAASIIEHTLRPDGHFLTREDISVYLFEKNSSIGAKVIISGGGRCNVTTGYYRRKDLESKYIRGSERVREAIGQFGPRKIYQRFESHDVPLKTEKDMRVFPVSDNGKDIVGVFSSLFEKEGWGGSLHLKLSTGIDSIKSQDDIFVLVSGTSEWRCDAVIIATGGQTYRQTGSTGDAYDRAQSLGHTITPLGPSLNSFLSSDKRMHALSGIAFEHARITINKKDKKTASGPLLLTHFGLSGPLAFIISAYSSFEMIDGNHPLQLKLMIDAEADRDTRDKRLLEAANMTPKKQLDTIVSQYLPKRLVDAILQEKFAGQELISIGQISKIVRLGIATFLGGEWTVSVIGRRPGDEFVTAGGVELSEVDNKSMMSKLVPGLFFAGEVLNIDGVTGGYNLTSSWATGKLAGESAIKYIADKTRSMMTI